MNICYVGTATSVVRGVPTTETGYDVTDFRQRWEDPKEYKRDEDGTRVGFWAGHDKSCAIDISGEITSATNALPFDLACAGAITVANLIDGYSITAGGVYLDTLELSFSRGQIGNFSMSATRLPNVA